MKWSGWRCEIATAVSVLGSMSAGEVRERALAKVQEERVRPAADEVRGADRTGSIRVGGAGAQDCELEAGRGCRHERNLGGTAIETLDPPRRKVSSSNSARARIR